MNARRFCDPLRRLLFFRHALYDPSLVKRQTCIRLFAHVLTLPSPYVAKNNAEGLIYPAASSEIPIFLQKNKCGKGFSTSFRIYFITSRLKSQALNAKNFRGFRLLPFSQFLFNFLCIFHNLSFMPVLPVLR